MSGTSGLLAFALLLGAGILAGPAAAQGPADETIQRRAALEQKMTFADEVLFRTPSARRVLASGHEDAKRALARGRELYAAARASIDAGNLAAAEDQVNEALRLAAQAKRLAPDRAPDEQQRLAVDRLLNQLQAFQASHLLSMRQISAVPGGATRPPELEQMRELVTKAQALAEQARYGEAWEILTQAAALVVGAAPKLMPRGAANYDPRPTNPEKEFEFENARYRSYQDLVPIALARFSPAPQQMREISALVDEGRGLDEQSRNLAAARNYRSAATFSRDATVRIQKALRLAGVEITYD